MLLLRDLLKECYINRPHSETNISALFWDVTQCSLVVIYQSFWETFRSHLQGASSPRRDNSSRTACTLKVEPIVCHETSTNYQSTLHNIPEERGSYLHCGGNLKTRTETNMLLITRSFSMLSISIVGKSNFYTLHSF